MKKKVFSLLILLILASCATRNPPVEPKNGNSTKTESSESKTLPPKIDKVLKTPVVWHLIDPVGIELKLLNIDDQKEEIIKIETSLSQVELPIGHWQIVGFKILGGEPYNVLNTSERFIFKVKNNKRTYGGSLLVQCPKIGTQFHSELKEMSFFNRYYFSSSQNLCEMIVGNKFKSVKRALEALDKKSKLPLIQGF